LNIILENSFFNDSIFNNVSSINMEDLIYKHILYNAWALSKQYCVCREGFQTARDLPVSGRRK
jgi:hypothetical protein